MNPITVTVTSDGQIMLPKTFRTELGIKQGDIVTLEASNGKILLHKKEALEDFRMQILASGAMDEWDSEEDNAAFNDL